MLTAIQWNAGTATGLALLLVVATKTADAAEPRTRTVDFSYQAVVRNIPANTNEVCVWIPCPSTDEHQQIERLEVVAPYPTVLATEREYGNRMLFLKTTGRIKTEIAIELKFRSIRREHRPLSRAEGTPPPLDAPRHVLARSLERDRLVPIDGMVRGLSTEITRSVQNDFDKARAIYNHATSSLTYDKTGTGWGRGDILYACDAKRGNCTDFHAVFVGFCRSQGIPARFQIGFSLPPDHSEGEIAGYHCWAEFYLPKSGWIPVDASEGAKHPERRDYFFGAHDEHRVQFSMGRDLRLSPLQRGEPLNYFIYPHVEVDGSAHTDVDKKFTFKDVKPAAGVKPAAEK